MQRIRSRVALVAALLWCACATVHARPEESDGGAEIRGVPPAIPLGDSDAARLFRGVPAPWREYLLKARRAEALDSRLARCLAYPDLPGNAWPVGYADAHCRYHFDDPLPLTETARYVDAGDIAGLEKRIRTIYSRHTEPGGEGVHHVFRNFEVDGGEALRVAERWVALAPRSGYAALALAEVWSSRGWSARGSKFVRDTPPEAFRVMHEFHSKATAEFRRAIELQPDLIDAYIGLINIGKNGDDDVDWAFEKARALDPGCGELAHQWMTSLQPRWGGSQMEVIAYAAALKPLVGARPLLANQQATPVSSYAESLEVEHRRTLDTLDLLDSAVKRSGEETSLMRAAEVRMFVEGDRRDIHRANAELAQIGRFNNRTVWSNRRLARYLLRRDPAWALRVARDAVAQDPSDADVHYLLGAAGFNSREFEEAEKHYLIAAIHDDYRQDALRELAEMWLEGAGLPPKDAIARAKPFVDRLLQSHPRDGRGLFMRMVVASRDGYLVIAPGNKEAEAFLAHADLKDRWQKERHDFVRDAMAAATSRKPAKTPVKGRKEGGS